MRHRSILWHIYPLNLVVIIVSLLAVAIFLYTSVADSHVRSTREVLLATARLVERSLRHSDIADESSWVRVDSLCKDLGALTGARATIVLSSGRVIGDSQELPASMENHRDRPEVASALAGRVGISKRFSDTLRRKELYVSVPLIRGDRVVAAVRVSTPLTSIEEMLRTMRIRIALGAVAAAVLAAVASYFLARRVAVPLDEIRQGLERFSKDDLSYRLPNYRIREVEALARGLNDMADRLNNRMADEVRRRNELEAVLSAMIEGLVVVDIEERVVRMNRAAAAFLGLEDKEAVGKSIQEVVRNSELQRFISEALSSANLIEGDISIVGPGGDRFLQIHGSELQGADGTKVGAVIVLNDVTRLKRLEKIRRDFVANVSHELKTPITSIKGFVETLRDGAIRDQEKASKFFEIIAKQTDRMNAIVDDLLFLSRLEQNGEAEKISLERMPLRNVIVEAMEIASNKAQEKGISISLDCPDDAIAEINPALLEQAILNLLDNAIKYSDEGGKIEISVRRGSGEVTIDVADHGCGIEAQHLERIFERFYRVDKARSRQLGGTGLGLAIVKHIVQAHGGFVTVKSKPAAGSTFTIHLPRN